MGTRIAIKIDKDIIIQHGNIFPLIDGHMHIQSNDIAPIPIMKGVLYKNLNLARIIGSIISFFSNRKKRINFIEISCREKTEAAALPGLFAGLGRPADAIIGIYAIFSSVKGERELLTDMASNLGSLFIKDYGVIARHNSYLIAGLYMNALIEAQLTIASKTYYVEDPKIKTKLINESKNERAKLIEARINTKSIFERICAHYYTSKSIHGNSGRDNSVFSAEFAFSIVHSMELMYAHYWGAYGIPVYIPYENKLYYIINEVDLYNNADMDNNSISLHNAYDISSKMLASYIDIKDINGKIINSGFKQNLSYFLREKCLEPDEFNTENKYCHFLSEINDSEIIQFEDFEKHLMYTKLAVLRYPFKLLPFYHFDARRFFAPSITAELPKYHKFYINHKSWIQETDISKIVASLNGANVFQYKMDINDLKNELLLNGGLFWGIKMYTALGYPPYLHNKEEAKKIYPYLFYNENGNSDQDNEGYTQLLSFYRYCAKNKIPVTCHCSPQGMTIADPGIYLKEFLKRNSSNKPPAAHFPIDGKGFMNGLGLVDDFSSPYSWELVLKDMGTDAKDFKLCLAHFGGKGFFTGEYDITGEYAIKDSEKTDSSYKAPYHWFPEICKLIENNNYNVYTDISCFVYEDFEEMPPVIQPKIYQKFIETYPIIKEIYKRTTRRRGSQGHRTQYTQYELNNNYKGVVDNNSLIDVMGLRLDLIQDPDLDFAPYRAICNTAELLKNCLEKNTTNLRHRILFGTDWPLSEMTVTGVPIYNSAVFLMLQVLTNKLGNKWDAWHQFSVINPLRFLGLLMNENDYEGDYVINFDKFYEMEKNLKLFNTSSTKIANDFADYGLDGESVLQERIAAAYKDLFEKYANKFIPAANKIKADGSNRLRLTNR
jgi:hypothetical protein